MDGFSSMIHYRLHSLHPSCETSMNISRGRVFTWLYHSQFWQAAVVPWRQLNFRAIDWRKLGLFVQNPILDNNKESLKSQNYRPFMLRICYQLCGFSAQRLVMCRVCPSCDFIIRSEYMNLVCIILCHRSVDVLMCCNQYFTTRLGQYHVCWCPGLSISTTTKHCCKTFSQWGTDFFKATLPLSERIVTESDFWGNTGPRLRGSPRSLCRQGISSYGIYNYVNLITLLSSVMAYTNNLGVVSIRKTVLPGMAIPMLKIRRPYGRLIFNMESPYIDKTVFMTLEDSMTTSFCTTQVTARPKSWI